LTPFLTYAAREVAAAPIDVSVFDRYKEAA